MPCKGKKTKGRGKAGVKGSDRGKGRITSKRGRVGKRARGR